VPKEAKVLKVIRVPKDLVAHRDIKVLEGIMVTKAFRELPVLREIRGLPVTKVTKAL
jgi:hypothetical protein